MAFWPGSGWFEELLKRLKGEVPASSSGGGFSQKARIEYVDGAPAWPVKVVHPSRFKDAEYDLRFELFRMPHGALIACLLRLYDIPESPYFLHRVFDVAFPPVNEYLRALVRSEEWSLILQSRGTEPGLARALRLDSGRLGSMLGEGERYNASIQGLDGTRALRDFLSVFEPEAEKAGCEAGWKAVQSRLRRG